MKKLPLTAADKALVAAAVKVAKTPVLLLRGETLPPQVGAAARLDNGRIITSANLLSKPSNISTCAEPVAIAEAARMPGRKIKTIVAVFHDPGFEPKVVSPCGKCREVITDYAPAAHVILRDPGTKKLFKVKAADLIPFKFADYWHHRELI